jgi:hypothetical protein
MDLKVTSPFEVMLKDNPELVSHLRRKYKNDFVVMDKKVFLYDIAGETVFAREYILKRKIDVRKMKQIYMSKDRDESSNGVIYMVEKIFEDIMAQTVESKIFLLSIGGGDIKANKDTCQPEMDIIVKGLF